MDALAQLNASLTGRYAIEREIGRGGMATVYLARDLRHNRRVALKLLNPELGAVLGVERFLSEIQVTANLQHPNLLPLFDSGEAEGLLFYVMPYVDGESLRTKLQREKQLPVEEAVHVASAVASALDYAHRHGVIHRDLKPENILLHEGQPMVADFGIALAVSNAGGNRITQTGLSLGTPQYMSPEQATGDRVIDGRTDIYSLGAVTYEMLTGEPPHSGTTAQAIIAKVITDRPRNIRLARDTVPAYLEAAVERALAKLPADRFHSANELAEALRGRALFVASEVHATIRNDAQATARARLARTMRSPVTWAVAFVSALLAGAMGWAFALIATQRTTAATAWSDRWSMVLPDTAPLAFIGQATLGIGRTSLVASPDGRTVVYVAQHGRTTQLYSRRLDGLAASPIAGTAGAYAPFVSPDGQSIGFFVGSELRKVPITGGPAITIAQVPEPVGGAWASDDRILVAWREGNDLGWIPATGGELRAVPQSANLGRTHPRLLPGEKHALVNYWHPRAGIGIGVTDLSDGRTVALTSSGPQPVDSIVLTDKMTGFDARYIAGHLLFTSRGRLMAVPFDHRRWRLLGPPVEVWNELREEAGGSGQYAVTDAGTVIYARGSSANLGRFAWAEQSGRLDTLAFPSDVFGTFDLSRDGRRIVVVSYPVGRGEEIRVLDLARGLSTTVGVRGTLSMAIPRWWPDGRHIVYTEVSPRPPYRSATIRQLPGSSGSRDTIAHDFDVTDISPDTTPVRLVGSRGFSTGVWLLSKDSQTPTSLDLFPGAWGATFSPDGRWIAYTSNEAGQYEVFVVSADGGGERQKISRDGGEEPRWTSRGDALVYRWIRQWYSVSVPSINGTAFGPPRLVLEGPFINVPERSHDISPDGRRHLVLIGPQTETTNELTVVTNWLNSVRRVPKRGER